MQRGMLLALQGKLEYEEYLLVGSGAATSFKVIESKLLNNGAAAPDPHADHNHEGGKVEEMAYPFCTECVGEMKIGINAANINRVLEEDYFPLSTNGSSKGIVPSGGKLGDSVVVSLRCVIFLLCFLFSRGDGFGWFGGTWRNLDEDLWMKTCG